MKKFKQYLMSQDSWITITKSNVVAQHVDQWRSKPLHGQWPNLMLERSVNSSRWLQAAHLKPVTGSYNCCPGSGTLHQLAGMSHNEN